MTEVPHLLKLSIYSNNVRLRKITMMMSYDDVQLWTTCPTYDGKFTHNYDNLAHSYAKWPKAMGRFDKSTSLRLNNNDRR